MTKKDFLNTMVAGLSRAMSMAELTEARDYYAEQIEDRMEAGASEEEAVAALGDPEALVRQTLAEMGRRQPAPEREDDGGTQIRGEIRVVDLNAIQADVTICVEPLPEGESAQLSFGGLCRWTLSDGVLEIEEEEEKQMLFSWLRKQQTMKLTLSDEALRSVMAHARGGDIRVQGVRAEEAIRVTSASGDILLADADAGEVEAGSNSGDIEVKRTSANRAALQSQSGDIQPQEARAEALLVNTASGDIHLRDCDVRNLELGSSSGDVEVENCAATEMSLRSASGDLELRDTAVSGAIRAETSSGDITLGRISLGAAELCSASGDISGRLLEAEGGYAFEARSTHGEVRVPLSEGSRVVGVQTVAGDIHLRVEA